MTESDALIRKLAEIKSKLENRVSQLTSEIADLRAILEVVDSLLAEKSFKRLELPKSPGPPQTPETISVPPTTEVAPRQVIPLKTAEGVALVELQFYDSELKVIPAEGLKFDVSSPPLRSFLIARVLEPMQTADKEAAKTGQISADKILSYRMEQEGNTLKNLVIQNYGDERRQTELRSAIRWTFRRMYERLGSSQAST